MLYWRHRSQESQQNQLSQWPENRVQHMRAHQLKMNPIKSFLGVSSGKFPCIHNHIQRNSPWPRQSWGNSGHATLKTLKELGGLQGRLAYIWRFIANHLGHCQLFTRLMKKRRLLHMGWSLSKDFRRYQRIFHQASGPGGSHFGKIISTLCTRYGPLFGRSSSTEEWRRLRTGHLLLKQNSDRDWISIQPHQEGMSCPCIRCPEDTTLFGWPNHTCRFKS